MRLFIWVLLCFVPLFASATTTDGSVLLMNDSPFILTATVEGRDGTFLGQFTVQPGQQRNFTTNMYPTKYVHPGTPDIGLTPYIVIWQCPSEGFFSMCTDVSPGASCRASFCPGPHFCAPKQEQKKEAPASTLKKKN